MRVVPKIIVLFLFLLVPNQIYHSVRQKQFRCPAGVKMRTCDELMAHFISSSVTDRVLYQDRIIKDIVFKMSTLGREDKIKLILDLSVQRGNSTKLNHIYISLVNQIVDRKIVSVDDVNSILAKMNFTDFPKITFDGKRFIFEGDEYVSNLIHINTFISEINSRFNLQRSIREKMHVVLRDIEATPQELNLSANYLNREIRSIGELDKFADFILFSRRYSIKKQEKIFSLLNQVFDKIDPNNKILKRYVNSRRSIKKYRIKQMKKAQKDIKATEKKYGKNWKEIVQKRVRLYKTLHYGCRAKGSTKLKKNKAKKFTYVLMGTSALTSSMSYAMVPKNGGVPWYKDKDLGYTLAWSLMMSFVNGTYVFNNIKLPPATRGLLAYFVVAGEDAAISQLYGLLFGIKKEKLKEEIAKLKKETANNDKFVELMDYIKEKKLYEKYLEESLSIIKVASEEGKEESIVPLKAEELHQINIEDIDLEASQDFFLAAMAEKHYDSIKGEWLATGSISWDRFTYHRFFDLLGAPRSVLLSMLMYNRICRSVDPLKGYAQAALIFAAERFVSDYVYFYYRKKAINQ